MLNNRIVTKSKEYLAGRNEERNFTAEFQNQQVICYLLFVTTGQLGNGNGMEFVIWPL